MSDESSSRVLDVGVIGNRGCPNGRPLMLLAADVDGSVKCCCMFNASDIDDGDNIVDNTAAR